MKRTALPVCAAAVLIATAAVSAHGAEQGWYVGGGAGLSHTWFDDDSFNAKVNAIAPGLSISGVTKDDDSLMFKLFLGYSFTSFLALEANLFRLGEFATTVTTTPAGTVIGDFSAYGTSLDAVALLPFGDSWRVFVRGGGVLTRSAVDFTGTGAAAGVSGISESHNKFGWKAGAGIAYEFESGVGFRAEYEYYRVDNGLDQEVGVSSVSGSFLYRFK